MIAKALACVLLTGWLCQAAQARDYRYSDAHLHYVDFFQESEGMPALIKAMDAAGIEHSDPRPTGCGNAGPGERTAAARDR